MSNLTTCKTCKKEVSRTASACPHCGEKNPGVKAGEVVGGLIALVVVGWLVVKCVGSDSGISQNIDSPSQSSLESMAYIQCKNFVKDSLKSPKSADFPYLDFQAKNIGDDTFFVTSYVDAQNSFGAQLRTNYSCKIKYAGGSDADQRNWSLLDLQLSE